MEDIAGTVRAYILDTFLPGVSVAELADTEPLLRSGVLDSIAIIRLVSFLEERFGITIAPHEAGMDYLDTIAQITALVRSKIAAGGPLA